MPEPCPLVELHRTLRRKLRGIDSATLLTELGVPANLQSLVDGLRRTRACLEQFPDELDVCLLMNPEERLDSTALIDGIDQVLEWERAQSWPDDLRCRLPMERSSATARHPLAGYCLSVLLHWSDLYYVLEPGDAAASQDCGMADSFQSLMAEFSGYVIAAQAAIEPADYIGFCRKWWGAKQLPEVSLYPTRRLASRVAGASRAVRRLSQVEHRDLLQFLLDPANGGALHERVFQAMESARFKPERDPEVSPAPEPGEPGPTETEQAVETDWRMLQQIALLLEEVRPGWLRPDTVRRRRGSRRGTKRTYSQHRRFRDGYVRVPEQDVIRFDFATDDGLEVEHLQPMPAANPDEAAGSDGNSATAGNLPEPDEEPTTTDADDREAWALRDGTSWIPAGEQQTDGDIDVVTVTGEGRSDEPDKPTARWAGEHIRRYHLALGIRNDHLSLAQVLSVLKAISRSAQQQDPDKALLALHVSIALGRPIHEIAGFEVHAGKTQFDVDSAGIHYFMGSGEWVFNSPAPAWADMRAERIEQPRLLQLWLNDRTGFGQLVEHYDLFDETTAPARPFQRLTKKSRARLGAFLKRTLPQADATLAQCAGFLFRRLLSATGGDLGIASLITGRQHSHSGSVRHYANYPVRRVWRACLDAWLEDDEDWISSYLAKPGARHAGPPQRYGAKRVPEAEAVEALVTTLAERVRDESSPLAIRRDNYTAYTLVGMVLGLGMRPVIEPWVTGIGGSTDASLLVSFIDKAKSDYDRRINPVPEVLAQHLRRYTAYRNALAVTLPSSLTQARFVLLGSVSGKAAVFHPGDFVELVGADFPLELYSLRRFARTELASRYYVPAEDLDAYMGHWLFGVSPFDPLSTYPMQRLYDLAGGPLTRLLNDMGFAPLEPP